MGNWVLDIICVDVEMNDVLFLPLALFSPAIDGSTNVV